MIQRFKFEYEFCIYLKVYGAQFEFPTLLKKHFYKSDDNLPITFDRSLSFHRINVKKCTDRATYSRQKKLEINRIDK